MEKLAKDMKYVVVKIDNLTGQRTVKFFDYFMVKGMPTERGQEHWDGSTKEMEDWVNANSTAENTIVICEPAKIITRPGTPVWTPMGEK